MRKFIWLLLFFSIICFSDTPPQEVKVGSPANGMSISGRTLTIGLSSTSTTGALSATDWNTFNSKQSTITTGNLTDPGTDGIVVTSGGSSVLGTGTSFAQHVADSVHNGYLSSGDWSTFNGKQSLLTIGNFTDAGTDGITVTNGIASVIGSGTSISQHVADGTHSGYVSSTDWNTFNGKQSTLTLGNLSDSGTDGITVTSGLGAVVGSGTSLSQHVADTTHAGYLAAADWNTFNGKQTALTFTSPLVNTTGTVSCNVASGSGAGCLTSTDWTTFNGKQSSLTFTAPLVNTGGAVACNVGSGSQAGCIASADWTTFNSKQSTLTFSDSIVNTTGTVTLVNDSATPGNSMCYSTNSSGVLGWNACSSGGGSGTVTSITAGTGITLTPSTITTTGAIALTVPVAISSGGTNSTSVTTAPAATSWAGWDANKNFQANNLFGNYATQATANTTTSLTVSSPQNLYFTGNTSGQKVNLPLTSTLVVGMSYLIVNGSNQSVAIQTSAGTGFISLAAAQWGVFTCILASGTTTASWQFFYGYNAGTTGGLAVSLGGTGVSAVTTAPFATSFAGWDANKGFEAVVYNTDLTSTPTAAGTTTMTITSNGIQVWTGSTTQTIKLPTTSVKAGATYRFINLSTGALSIQSSGANAISTVSASARQDCTALVATPTTAANWSCL